MKKLILATCFTLLSANTMASQPIEFSAINLSPKLFLDMDSCDGSTPNCSPDILGAMCTQNITTANDLSQDRRATVWGRFFNMLGNKVKFFRDGFLSHEVNGIETKLLYNHIKMTDYDDVNKRPLDQHCGVMQLKFRSESVNLPGVETIHKNLFLNMNDNEVVQDWPNDASLDFDSYGMDNNPKMIYVKSYKQQVSPSHSVCKYEVVYQDIAQALQANAKARASIKAQHLKRVGNLFYPSSIATVKNQRVIYQNTHRQRTKVELRTRVFKTDTASCSSVQLSLQIGNEIVEAHKIENINSF